MLQMRALDLEARVSPGDKWAFVGDRRDRLGRDLHVGKDRLRIGRLEGEGRARVGRRRSTFQIWVCIKRRAKGKILCDI